MPDDQRRASVLALDEILGRKFPVLDDGFVRVVDYMGSDESIVQAARVSYGAGTKHVSEDRDLIRFLMRHRHTTPFEMCEIKLHVRVPMDHWRQWIRHRTANVNEYSTRYSEAIDSAASTEPDAWRLQSATNKQGSGGFVVEWPERAGAVPEGDIGAMLDEAGDEELSPGQYLTMKERLLHRQARDVYEQRLAFGVAREQARKDLPLSTYTEAYWKIDLHNLFHFLGLRMAPDAQLEIRSYATVMGDEIASRWIPTAWEAFCDYRLHSITFSAAELAILRSSLARQTPCLESYPGLSKREAAEFNAKVERIANK